MTALEEIKGIGPATVKKLNSLGIFSVNQLLFTLPTSYIDFKSPISLKQSRVGDFCLFKGVVRDLNEYNFKRKNFSLKIDSAGYTIMIYFFNQPYLQDRFEIGKEYLFYGKISSNERYGRIISNPDFEDLDNVKKLKGIKPIYPLKGIIGQVAFYKIIAEALKVADISSVSDCITSPLFAAVKSAHNPTSIDDALNARKRIACEELLKQVLSFKLLKEENFKTHRYSEIFELPKFGFDLSESQQRAVLEITNDMRSEKPMNRILVGDVGSGKTAVAFSAIKLCADSGGSAVMLAPTTILAKQHYEKYKAIGNNCAFVCGETPAAEKEKIKSDFKQGIVKVLFGTHTVLNDDFYSDDLWLAIVDEQQRFGVEQKDKIISKNPCVDVLSMTATPIPRTVALIFDDEISVSKIEKHSENNVKTFIVLQDKIDAMFEYIHKQCQSGKQAFIVCPKVYDMEYLEVYSVEKIAKKLHEKFSDVGFEIVFGKISAAKKSEALERFKNKQSAVVFATSVIEVGVDVPSASIMAIMNAENFGISTLHQMRGRVGRDGNAAECYLCVGSDAGENAIKRLKTVQNINDGFKLAEQDFETRGGGDYLGIRQSGKASGKFDSLFDKECFIDAKRIVSELLNIYDKKTLLGFLENDCLKNVENVSKI